jgi:hypothetical protein
MKADRKLVDQAFNAWSNFYLKHARAGIFTARANQTARKLLRRYDRRLKAFAEAQAKGTGSQAWFKGFLN